ncbi:MAG: L,D-transpeptidase family protein [Clostridiales bacterium]|jgi:L,D-transpeptidase ErfK/SrfK|nr:L,D-transpeptidase family protein [Clostridiales bacterium]
MTYASRYLRITDPLMEGIDVTNIQQRLSELGFYEGDITGVYDRQTAEAVRNFQQQNGLTADGIVGPDTWNAVGISPELLQFFNTEYNITIDLEEKELTLRQGEQILEVYPVAVGTPSTPTPTGNWRIIQKTLNPGGPFGARWMRLSVPWGGYGIHGTDEPGSIGTAASHGCVRMLNEDVIELYDIVPLGTEVKITGITFTGRTLYLGVQPGEDVRSVQEILQELGYYGGPLDAVYDEEVRDAVLELQKDYGLISDGVVGPNTYEVLGKLRDILANSQEP